jgi:hypothetical protein
MNKRLTTIPASRLICLGGAKASTNAIGQGLPENDVGDKFD